MAEHVPHKLTGDDQWSCAICGWEAEDRETLVQNPCPGPHGLTCFCGETPCQCGASVEEVEKDNTLACMVANGCHCCDYDSGRNSCSTLS